MKKPAIASLPLPNAGEHDFQVMATLPSGHITPEMLFLETGWSALVIYGLTAVLWEGTVPLTGGEVLSFKPSRRWM